MITDYKTSEGMIRVTDAREGALRKAYLYTGVYDSAGIQAAIVEWYTRIGNIGKSQALLAKSDAAKEAMHAARAKNKTVPFVPDMKLDDVLIAYKADPVVMKAARAYLALLERVSSEVPKIDLTPPYTLCFADDAGPVQRIGVNYAVGNDGRTYELVNGAWLPDTKGIS